MSVSHVLAVVVVCCGAAALLASVYLAVSPRRTGRRTPRLRPLTWHLARGGLVTALAAVAALCALAAVGLLGPGRPH